MTKPKALLIVHQKRSDPARVGAVLAESGYELDRRCPNLGDPLPESMEAHDIVVIFGGPMRANDRHNDDAPGIRVELDFIPKVLHSGKPLLGICLGAQMLAKTLGAEVGPHPEDHIEAGYYEIRPTVAGKSYFDGPMMVYQWHREGFTLPSGATLLAEGESYDNQAFRYGAAAFGIQFHPEVLEPNIRRWARQGNKRLNCPGARPRETHFSGFKKHDPIVDRWIRRFLAQITAIGDLDADAAD